MIIEIFTDKIASKILDSFVEILTKSGNEQKGEINSIENQLVQISKGIERLHMSDLIAAFEYMKLNKFLKARDKLVDAISHEEYSPVAHLWLSKLSFMAGYKDFAIEKYKRAMTLNPYVCLSKKIENEFLFTNENTNKDVKVYKKWGKELNDLDIISKIPSNWLKSMYVELSSGFSDKAQSAITKVSFSNGNPIVQWILGADLSQKSFYQTFLSAFSINDGHTLWVKLIEDKEFVFATPSLIVLKINSKEEDQYELIDSKDGSTLKKMGRAYFETVFSPNAHYMKQLKSFRQSIIELDNTEIAREKSSDYSKKDGVIIPYFNHTSLLYENSLILKDPFYKNSIQIKAINKWEHLHLYGTQSSMTRCGLGCNSEIIALQNL